MAYVITDACIDVMDQSCVDVCPVDCIHFTDGEDRMLYINPEECIDCGACEPACPVNAIYPEDAVPADQTVFKEINALWYQDPDAARARVEEWKPRAAAAAS
jgi:ferredoxin